MVCSKTEAVGEEEARKTGVGGDGGGGGGKE